MSQLLIYDYTSSTWCGCLVSHIPYFGCPILYSGHDMYVVNVGREGLCLSYTPFYLTLDAEARRLAEAADEPQVKAVIWSRCAVWPK